MKYFGRPVMLAMVGALALFAMGCAASRNINKIAQSVEGYELQRIVVEGAGLDCMDIGQQTRALLNEYEPQRCMVTEYRGDGGVYTVTFVSFQSGNGAVGAFSVMGDESDAPVQVGQIGRVTGRYVQFVKGTYLVTVIPEGSASIDGALTLARQLDPRILGTIGVGPFESLVGDNLVERSELYFMGPHGLAVRYPLKLVEALLGNEIEDGVAAEYDVDRWIVDLLRVSYSDASTAREAMNSYLQSFSGGPLVYPDEMLQYYTIVVPDRSEVYITQYGNAVYLMFGNPPGGQTKPFYEYILRGLDTVGD